VKEKNEEELEHLQSVHTAEPSGTQGVRVQGSEVQGDKK